MEHTISEMGVTRIKCACGWTAETKDIRENKTNGDKMLDAHAFHVEMMGICGK